MVQRGGIFENRTWAELLPAQEVTGAPDLDLATTADPAHLRLFILACKEMGLKTKHWTVPTEQVVILILKEVITDFFRHDTGLYTEEIECIMMTWEMDRALITLTP